MAQVREHTESTKSQYALAGKAAALGWARSDIEVIDTDLGISDTGPQSLATITSDTNGRKRGEPVAWRHARRVRRAA
jgi:hypothetical protein